MMSIDAPTPEDLEIAAYYEAELEARQNGISRKPSGLSPEDRRDYDAMVALYPGKSITFVWDKVEQDRKRRAAANVFPVLSAEDLSAELGPVPYVCQGLRLAPGLPTLVAGYGYAGKTIAMQSVAVSIAAGKDVWGVFGVQSGPIGHIDWEQGKRTTVGRYQRLCRDMGVDAGELTRTGMLNISIFPNSYLSTKNIYDALCRFSEGKRLCIYDSLTAALPGVDENDSRVGEYMYLLGRVSEATGSVQTTIHHARKPQDGDEGDPRRAIRGSTALYNGSSVVFVLIGKKGQPVKWCCEKERHEGKPIEDFYTKVEDTPHGVRIVHLEPEQVSSQNESFMKACERVYQGILTYPGMSARGLSASLRMQKEMVLGALEMLEKKGAAINRGTKSRPEWFGNG